MFALGAIMAERAANIWRGEAKPYVATLQDLREFAKAWDPTTRASFNPAKKKATGRPRGGTARPVRAPRRPRP